ncbi:hypothetical protein TL16_g11548 [Triparma laevis f. inornata]|uniref:Uncharacterized protein n=2 Tax=Triparma laevis TaxID=1534972 RepID=A0A9W7AAF7_9STRA|nr:hypothetical protein TrLO_g5741 [Triparma laevis f. longispina]GMH89741.1 hypothetical protein TL16_g11548 [Triparma laevis f. inornata]
MNSHINENRAILLQNTTFLQPTASIDSMPSSEFTEMLNILSEILEKQRLPTNAEVVRFDRRAALSEVIQKNPPTSPKSAFYREAAELGDADMAKRLETRRGSMNGSLNPDQAKANIQRLNIAVIKVLGWAGADKANIEELAEQFDSVVANSSDVVVAVSAWFDKSVPTQGMTEEEKEGFRLFFITVARRNLSMKKMARIGVTWKLAITLILGYFDVLTDLLVSRSYMHAGDCSTAYATAGFAFAAIIIQATFTFINYWKKTWKERFGRTLLALLGMAPVMEGASVWTGKEDPDLVVSGPVMYASIKAIEIAIESIPESIIQVNGILKTNRENIKGIQIIGIVSSIAAGAFIITDGNFGQILSMHLKNPGDPYFGWISKNGGLEKKRQMIGMFMFNACYFAQFVFAMSLTALAFGSVKPLLALLAIEFCVVCAYMGKKGELLGWAMMGKSSQFTDRIVAPFIWFFYYMLVSAVPLLIAAAPMELGPEVFATTMVWRLFTNGGIIHVALGELSEKHYLGCWDGMTAYGVSLTLVAVGLVLFFVNCDPNFDRSLFWRPKSGKQHIRESFQDESIWAKGYATKDDENWSWVVGIHPTYLPFDEVTPWICDCLAGKYDKMYDTLNKGVERPEWMSGKENEGKFIERVVEIYTWRGEDDKDVKEVNKALTKLFGKNGGDEEDGVLGGKVTFIKCPGKKRNSRTKNSRVLATVEEGSSERYF